MLFLKLILFIGGLSIGHLAQGDISGLDKAFRDNEVIPDVMDEVPTEELKIDFGDGVMGELCQLITPTQAKAPPALEWTAEPDALYTVISVGPDGPIRVAPWREYLFWMILNVPGTNLADGDEWVSYIGPMPAPVSGALRYVTMVLKQNDGQLSVKQPKLNGTTLLERRHFRTSRFAREHNLSWPPVAGNCFMAKWDEQVDEWYRQLGLTIW